MLVNISNWLLSILWSNCSVSFSCISLHASQQHPPPPPVDLQEPLEANNIVQELMKLISGYKTILGW